MCHSHKHRHPPPNQTRDGTGSAHPAGGATYPSAVYGAIYWHAWNFVTFTHHSFSWYASTALPHTTRAHFACNRPTSKAGGAIHQVHTIPATPVIPIPYTHAHTTHTPIHTLPSTRVRWYNPTEARRAIKFIGGDESSAPNAGYRRES